MRVGFVAGEHADSMSKADGLDIANHSPTHVSASLPLSAVPVLSPVSDVFRCPPFFMEYQLPRVMMSSP